jgi:hypothetical protein
MQRMPLVLLATAAILWGTGIGYDAEDGRDRIWMPLLAAAAAATIAGFNLLLAARADRSNRALATAVLSRPLYRDPTGPIPAVPPQPQPAAPASNGHTPRGRHGIHARG